VTTSKRIHTRDKSYSITAAAYPAPAISTAVVQRGLDRNPRGWLSFVIVASGANTLADRDGADEAHLVWKP
jgi:hypothetical protein